ncbi:carcinoembryonic antigen-related cell adhesion molecule 16-like [Varanus komodoensis]|uniref:carcinoembryonic antigen-related cell adhesion molecule 16-like n=1 Tax=Varanus komodoensis TaxID=61221 RepID=UPI001CF7E8C4|nr:carcinoembryonic antigen-related cell adhesion molecule 16-like [Varanus komodoensis]
METERRRRRPCAGPGWRGAWRPAALLAASILSSCFLLTRAQDGRPQVIPITWSPQYPTAGENVTLTPGGTLEKVVSCSWFRGTVTDVAKRILVYYVPPLTQGQVNGPSYTGRETVDLECSLHIQNLTLTDSGNYTVSKEGGVTAIGHVMIKVSDRPGGISNIILWSIIGSLVGVLILIAILLFIFLRSHH